MAEGKGTWKQGTVASQWTSRFCDLSSSVGSTTGCCVALRGWMALLAMRILNSLHVSSETNHLHVTQHQRL